MANPTPGEVSLKAFARILGERSPSYITQLKEAGRLVMSADGKRVCVEASLQRIRETADPGKDAVAARHAAERAAKAVGGEEGAAAAPVAAQSDVSAEGEPIATSGYQHWRERGERAKALSAERENAIAEGKLLVASEVTGAVATAITTLRTRLEHLPDILGPQLAALQDEGACRAMLAEHLQYELEEAARQFHTLARQGAP